MRRSDAPVSGRQPASSSAARAALALALDGFESDNHEVARAALRAGLQLTAEDWGAARRALNAAPDGAVQVVGGSADNVAELLAQVGAHFSARPQWDAAADRARVVFLGCPRHTLPFDEQRMLRFAAAGGVLVTSDHAVAMPALRALLPGAGRGAPKRARACRPTDEADGLLPAVYLPAGHERLAPLSDDGRRRTLAFDALTGDPLVVRLRVGAGALLHAVPHWFQDEPTPLTDVERRPAAQAPGYAGLGISRPDVTVGGVQSAATMLGLLLEGLSEVALGAGGWPVPPDARDDAAHG